jgi:hypothetical protein
MSVGCPKQNIADTYGVRKKTGLLEIPLPKYAGVKTLKRCH